MIQDFSRGKLNYEICWGGKKIHTLFTGESFHGAYFHRETLWDGFRRDTETGYSGIPELDRELIGLPSFG